MQSPRHDRKSSLRIARMNAFIGGVLLICALPSATQAQSPVRISASDRFNDATFHLPEEPLLGFVPIATTTFPMGSNPLIDPQAFENERWSESRRQGVVEVPQFYIARYETTQEQFAAFVNATGFRVTPEALNPGGDYPVTHVAWTDAVAYTRWLDAQLRSLPTLPSALKVLLDSGARVQLPTEAQWEVAAKGAEGRIYPWGNQFIPEFANVDSTGPQPVGSKSCTPCLNGLADMSGNVWEWTRSPYQPYPYSDADDRANLAEDALWVMRGGSYSDAPNNARASVRGAADPGARRPFIGFRVVISPP